MRNDAPGCPTIDCMGGKRPIWRRAAPAILAALLGFGAGVATGAAKWNRARWEYHTGPGGLLYRMDCRTGQAAYHNPRTCAWETISDPQLPPGYEVNRIFQESDFTDSVLESVPTYSDLPPGTVSVQVPRKKP